MSEAALTVPANEVSDILRLRRRPTAFLLLSYLRSRYATAEYFPLAPEPVALTLGRTTRTIRVARDALLDTGYLVRVDRKPERPEGVRGRQPNYFAFKA